MIEKLDIFYSENCKNMKRSVIRELLKLTNKPDLISFAGGLPSPDTFPVEELKEASIKVYDKYSAAALQYGSTEGDDELKNEIIKFEKSVDNIDITPNNLLIVSASQQALDMVTKIFIDPGDIIITERPTYVGAIGAFNSYRAKLVDVPFDPENDGMDMAILENTIKQLKNSGSRIKFIYVIPDFQNPSGICWSLENRKKLLEIAYEHSLLVIEDSPYREIRFMGESVPSLYSLDTQNQVINLKTFSKILVPGTRLGWIMAPEEIIQKLVIAKQSMDLCTNILGQKIILEYMKQGTLYERINKTRKLYAEKRNFMLKILEENMPKHKDITWTKPEGGLFLWISLPKSIDTEALFYKAIDEKVAYVVGSAFYADSPEYNSMRINFSFSSLEQIELGIKRLCSVIRKELENIEKKRTIDETNILITP